MYRTLRLSAILLCLAIGLALWPNAPAGAHGDEEHPNPAPAPGTAAPALFLPLVSEKSNPQQFPDGTAADQGGGLDEGHGQDDYALAERARLRNERPFVAPAQIAGAADDLSAVGQWGPVFPWPFAFASAANLPDGRILAWGANRRTEFTGGTTTYAAAWDPASGELLLRNHIDHSMFCGMPTLLEDGRIFVNGGDGTRERVSTYDYRTNAWTRVQDMNTGRWYPGSLALPNGQVFTALGDPGSWHPELWTPNTGWTYLEGIDIETPVLDYGGYQADWLPYLFLNKDGRILHTGPTLAFNWIDPTGNGSNASAGVSNDWYTKYSTTILYDENKILVAGGQISATNKAATDQAMIVDLSGASPVKTILPPMHYARKFNSGVVLPTGEVLIIGGTTAGREFSDIGTVLTPEIWNPTTRTWRTVAPHSVPRNYHSVALLMTDGRVFAGGGGLCNCPADHPDHQVYSPPYLFNADGSPATRPQINSAPNIVSYGRAIDVSATPGMQKFSLIKMSGTTHNLNSDLRYLSVPFSEMSSGQYRLTLHANRNVLTPGYWMLFAVNAQGVPSVAKVLMVSSTDAPLVANPGPQSSPQGSAVSLQMAASDPTGDALSFSASGLPQGLSIHPTSGLISGTAGTPGAYNATVSVSDGANITSVSFAWSVMAPGLVRYVKLEALSEVAGNAWTTVAEFNVLDANGVPIARNGWVVSADSEEIQGENGRAANAVDGSTSTIWHTQWQAASPTHPHWLQVNLGGSWSVGAFRYLPRQDMANGRIAAYRFYISADGTNWGAAVAAGTFANDVQEKTVSVPQTAPPNITAPAPQVSVQGSSVNLPITAGDPDPQDTIVFSAGGLPPGVAIDGASGIIAGVIPNTAVGSYTPTVTARDSRGFASSVSFNWTVQALPFTVTPIVSPPKPLDSAVSYTAAAANAINPRYKWLFGDGTPETAYSPEATTSHSFSQPGLYVVRVTVTDDRGGEQSTTFVQAVHRPLTGGKPSASSAIVYEQRSGGDRVWLVNPDNDSVSVFDAASGSRLAEIPVGAAPRSLALGPNGQVWVTNKKGGTISVVDGGSLAVARTIPLPPASQPFGIVFAPGGEAAYVALEGSGQVLQIDPASGAVVRSAAVGANPRHLSISADGTRLLVARFITPPLPGEATAAIQPGGGGEVIALDTSTLSVARTVLLQPSGKNDTEVQGRGVPNYLGAPAISPDGLSAWVPSKQDNVLRGTLRDGSNLNFQNTVRAISSRIDLSALGEDYGARLDLDNSGLASAAAFDPYGVYLFVALETSREVAVVDIHGRRELFRIPVGRAPQGLAVSPDGRRLFVQNFMDRTLGMFDIASLVNAGSQAAPALAAVPSVASERLGAQVLSGKQLFYDAKDPRLAQDAYISCASCHNDGGHDGRVWDLTGFGEGLRNTIDLQGHGGMGQGPLHWSANFDEVQDFEAQIRALSGGLGLMSDADFSAAQASLGAPKADKSADLDALAAYVASLSTFAPSPYRNGDGTLTAEGAAGKSVFLANGCGRCHAGAAFSNSAPNNLQNVGTIKPSSGSRLSGPLTGLDTPTLRNLWQTGPYLHDGSAPALPDAVRAHSGVALAEGDLSVLVAYLQQIDGSEPPPPNQLPGVNLTSPANGAVFNLGGSINLAASAADVDGVVTKVEFLVGTTLLNSDTSAPYSFTWTPTGLGAYSITARAYDDRGAVTSAAANITVNSGVASGGLLGSYYGNVSFSGAPLLQRVEAVNFDWGNAAPAAGVPGDLYSVRWVGRVQAPVNGNYYFRTVSDDGVRLWVNGVQRINNWTDHGATTNTSAAITLSGGQWYNVTLEYYERRGKAVMQLQWRTPGTTTYAAIPPAQLSPQ